jgi:hypothetical protein
MKGKLIQHIKVREDTGNIVEIKMWQVKPSPDKPHGYKYSLVYIVHGQRVIGYDNSEQKGDHKHYDDKELPYDFKDLKSLVRDFQKDIKKYRRRAL